MALTFAADLISISITWTWPYWLAMCTQADPLYRKITVIIIIINFIIIVHYNKGGEYNLYTRNLQHLHFTEYVTWCCKFSALLSRILSVCLHRCIARIFWRGFPKTVLSYQRRYGGAVPRHWETLNILLISSSKLNRLLYLMDRRYP